MLTRHASNATIYYIDHTHRPHTCTHMQTHTHTHRPHTHAHTRTMHPTWLVIFVLLHFGCNGGNITRGSDASVDHGPFDHRHSHHRHLDVLERLRVRDKLVFQTVKRRFTHCAGLRFGLVPQGGRNFRGRCQFASETGISRLEGNGEAIAVGVGDFSQNFGKDCA